MSGSTSTNAVRNGIINAAKDVPTAIALAKGTDPALADFLTGKALVGSWTVWVAVLTPAVSWLATQEGFGWDSATSGTVATVLTSLAMIAMRTITRTPITGVVTPAPVQPATPPGP
jgi:hypothetical protein